MTVKPLPVPPLEDTLSRFLTAAEPLVDPETLERTREQTERFASEEGPRLQAALEEFARAEDAEGRSWLSREWLNGYLTVRTPLPLTTSVGFQITGDYGAPGLGRAAELVYRAASVHLRQVRGETPQEVDPRGNPVSMTQWECLTGGVRHPRPERDEIRRPGWAASSSGAGTGGAPAADAAEIGVIHRGRLYALPVSTGDRRPVPLRTVAEGLRAVLERDEPRETELPFGALSYLGSEAAAPLLDRLTGNPHNAEVYERLTRMLFVVHLVEARAELEEHLERAAFEVGHAWAYKPITYEVCLEDDWLAMHVEHSTVDGATILAVAGALQEVAVPEEAPLPDAPAPSALTWDLTSGLRADLVTAVAAYRAEAAMLGVHRVVVPRPHRAELPFRISDDAAQQLVMLLAQLATYGRVRGVYEAVDMREYRAGRTECLRPVTPQAVAFVRALHEHTATEGLFTAALDAHRDWVKACKSARGVDRHLLGLALMARELGEPSEFLASPALAAVRHDFLSTTSIGGPDAIVRYAFAPTTPEGFGVTYTAGTDGYEFCVNHRRDTSEDLEGFAHNLAAAADTLWEFVGTLHP
ncbi:choline/carnitine O-acyltransferase [Kocuria tytonis]|uniref:Choline/carnitine O-acyltransferase n=1 Tax=Kocuria tytonis TaxID=2054280 RepID=A0A495A6C3_9MICC|nr:choline/carnitine O-acyltransferase [Kocuria tytonis]RKQ35280.1 choline/carnitine O-acyltransferase [Kocuria tytonis]